MKNITGDRTKEGTPLIVCRLGELFLKGQNRPFFVDKLGDNIKACLKGVEGVSVFYVHGRFFVRHPAGLGDELLDRLSKVFGLSSVSPVIEVEKDIEAIKRAALALVEQGDLAVGKKTFAVRAHRSDKSFPYPSPEIGRIVGDAVGRAIELPVDLKNPDLKVEVEVGPKATFVFVKRVKGGGGLPVGVSGRMVLLLSAGIDSPVAGWLMMKRGVRVDALTFHSPPYTDEAALDKVVRLAERMAKWGVGEVTLRAARFTEVQKLIHRSAPDELGVVLYRRMMMRAACMLARKVGAQAIITGESLGQVASQTIENMTRVEEVSSLPVLRPLIGFDKAEIIRIAQRLDTYRISIEPHIDSCTLFTPKHPVTRAGKSRIERAERGIDTDFDEVARSLAEEAEFIRIQGYSSGSNVLG